MARCAIYCGDVAFWNALVALCIGAVVMVDAALAGRVEAVEAYLLIFLALVAWLTASYRLFRAFQLYLRFHRPLLTVAASQVIVFLVFLFVVTTLWR